MRCEVDLRSPVPLDTALAVVREAGGSVSVLDGDVLVGEGRAAGESELEVPAPVGPAEARRAAAAYRGLSDGVFSRCFVCGRAREDAFGVFAGAVGGRALVASPWTPGRSTADGSGRVAPEFVWSVLDCPTFFASYLERELGLAVLVQLTARIRAPVSPGSEHVVIAWPLGVEGRKRYAGSAVLSAAGETLAVARALMVEPRSA